MSASAAPTPPGWRSVTPRIVARGARELVEFVVHVLGAEAGPYDPAAPAIVTVGDSRIMVSDAGARAPTTAFLYVYLADVDAAYERAIARGAKSMEAPFDTPYGDRRCMLEDPWGNTWQLAAHRGAATASR